MKKVQMIAAGLLVLGVAGMASVHPAYAGSVVTNCPTDEAALSADISNAGSGGTVVFNCSRPTTIYFDSAHGGTGPISIGRDVTLDAGNSEPVTLDGGNSIYLFQMSSTYPQPHFTLKQLALVHGSGAYSGAIYDAGGTLTIANSSIDDNAASLDGGAIYNSSGTVTITNSTISRNKGRDGGAIYSSYGQVNISDSTLSHNSARSGGAIQNFGGVTITGSTLAHNSATASNGAIFNYGTLTVGNSTFADNSAAGDAGAISSSSGTATITNSTFAHNAARGTGGALYNNGGASTMQVSGSIVADSTSGGNCYGAILDGGYNLESGTDCGFAGTGDRQNTAPDLKALATNGGPTETMALDAKSLAIDAIPAASGLCPSTDQRGVTRLDDFETACDIGAYEHLDHLRIDVAVSSGQYSVYIDGANLLVPSTLDWHALSPHGDHVGSAAVTTSAVHIFAFSHPCPSGHITVDASAKEASGQDVTVHYEGDPC